MDLEEWILYYLELLSTYYNRKPYKIVTEQDGKSFLFVCSFVLFSVLTK